jgi:hypothetical protein
VISALPAAAPFTRRTALAAAAALPLAACRWGPEEQVDGASEQEQDADAALVSDAKTALVDQLASLTAITRRHRGLAGLVQPLQEAHAAHLAALGGNDLLDVVSIATDRSSAAAVARVRREETALQQKLADLAGRVTSGPLARALASMSASLAQHLAAMPTLPKGPA